MAKPSTVKSDRFSRARGGPSRVLEISCAACGTPVARYQKDGTGALKRMYLDRFDGRAPSGNLVCAGCDRVLGVPMVYRSERRPAIRLVPGSVKKQLAHP